MIASMPGLSVSERVSPETLPHYRAVQDQAAKLIGKDITTEQGRLAISEMLHKEKVARFHLNLDDLREKQKKLSDPTFYSGRAHYAALQTKLNTPEGLSVGELPTWRRLSRKFNSGNEYSRDANLADASRNLIQTEAILAVGSMLAPLAGYESNTGANSSVSNATTPLERRGMTKLSDGELAAKRIHPGLFRTRLKLEDHGDALKSQRYFRPVATVNS